MPKAGAEHRRPPDSIENSCPVLGQLNIPIAQASLTGELIWSNKAFSDLLGFTPAELSKRKLAELLPDCSDVLQRLSATDSCITASAVSRQGVPVSLEINHTLIHDAEDSGPNCHLLIFRKCPAEELNQVRAEFAGRLIQAQEAERTRIARELHDEIGQELAILRIQMQRAGKPVSDIPGRSHPGLPELSQRVAAISTKLSRLSRQLHSSTLHYLGLEKAVNELCVEFASQYKIALTPIFENVPAQMDGMIGLSCFRIVQEALHNIAKHSGAKNVRLELACRKQEISLLIQDDGKGFDLGEARLAAGLGLISMRERMNLIGGSCEISSQKGHGTKIYAKVPLQSQPPVV